jgi:hypothetical protein
VRVQLSVALIGVLSGAAGALLVGRFSPAPKPAAPIVPGPAPPVQVIVPPGWDPRFATRLAGVEDRLAALRTGEPPSAAEPHAVDEPAGEREREREEVYRADLELQDRAVEDHGREPRDAPWANREASEIRVAMSAAPVTPPFAVRAIDCRSKTCLATVTFSSPAEALQQHEALSRVVPPGCNGLTSALQPPNGDGAYDTTVVYYCR